MVNDRRFRQLDVVVDVHVCTARTRGILRSSVRQDAHVAVLVRLYQQEPGAPSVPVLRDGHRHYLALAGESVDATRTLLPAPLRMAHVRMLRRTSERVRELSPVARGPVTRRAVRRAERTTRGHRVCLRSSGPVTGSWGCF